MSVSEITRTSHAGQVLRVLFLIFAANLSVALLKIIIGGMIHSGAMTADGIHSLSDGASNIVGILGVYMAARPRDKGHPYGHAKIETLAGMVIGLVLIAAGFKVFADAMEKFSAPQAIEVSLSSLAAMIFTLVINVTVTAYEKRMGTRLGDDFLIADSIHTKSDIFVTVGVLVALLAMKLGLPAIIDPLVSLVVVFFIFRAAWEVLSANGSILLDATSVDPDTVRHCVSDIPGVAYVHEIRSRGSANRPYIEMHIEVDPNMTVRQCHRLTHEIEEHIRAELGVDAQVQTHVEPLGDPIEGSEADGIQDRSLGA
jgi:cation diffusion facilitator family transporter